MSAFRDERIWRILSTVWTIAFMAFVVVNFFALDAYAGLIAPLSAIYAGVLTIYVSTKEFDRWYDTHHSRHPGELFVIGWTALALVLSAVTFFSAKNYHIAPEVVANYIMVLTIFALTQKSKKMHRARRKETVFGPEQSHESAEPELEEIQMK